MTMAMQHARQHGDLRQGDVVGSRRHHDRDEWNGNALAMDEERLASALGWFSIGLGLAQLAAPASVARLIGVTDDEQNCRVLQAVGLRELGSGIGILAQPRPSGWVWTRVAGDVVNLALLGTALTSERSRGGRLAAATVAVAGVTVVDALCAQRLSERTEPRPRQREGALARWVGIEEDRAVRVRKSITIGKPQEEVYRFWRDLQNLPRFMSHLDSVEVIDERRSRWTAKAPFGRRVSWEADIIEDKPNERLAWRSLEGADVPNSGSVTFERAPGGRGTVVRVELRYEPPAGIIGATFAKLFGREPGQEVQEDLRVLKQVMETGEVTRSDDSVSGGGPARPVAQVQ